MRKKIENIINLFFKNDNFFEQKINGYFLDREQKKAILTKGNVQLIASAGSGKTLTIVGKVKYLLEVEKKKEEEILCISFTRKSAKSLESAINKERKTKVEVKTFHKLALDIVNKKNCIAPNDLLEYISEEYLKSTLWENEPFNFYLKEYLKYQPASKDNIYLLTLITNTFIHLFKTNCNKKEDFKELFLKVKRKPKEFLLLRIIYEIYLIYEEELKANGWYDFDDLILEATKKIIKKEVIKKYSNIIIDEFQDTSFLRLKLIKSLLKRTNANLFVVGDDYQSIYKFTGCDLSLFLNLKKEIPNLKLRKLTTTYRFSMEAAKISTKLIRKNKMQCRKKVRSIKKYHNPITLCFYKEKENSLAKLLSYIYKKGIKEILILSRNNNDILFYIDKNYKMENDKIFYLNYKDIDITYLTVHKAKGLEAECVIILNVIDDKLGFPNKILENKILSLIHVGESFEEERRLFYVAITRAKKETYIMTEVKRKSMFVKELEKESNKEIKKIKI